MDQFQVEWRIQFQVEWRISVVVQHDELESDLNLNQTGERNRAGLLD